MATPDAFHVIVVGAGQCVALPELLLVCNGQIVTKLQTLIFLSREIGTTGLLLAQGLKAVAIPAHSVPSLCNSTDMGPTWLMILPRPEYLAPSTSEKRPRRTNHGRENGA